MDNFVYKIRKATEEDLSNIRTIFEYAREQMKLNGNSTQWGDDRPNEKIIVDDIQKGNGYVVELDGNICGYFAFIIGPDPTYTCIYEGKWKNDLLYGTIHRIAKYKNCKNVMQEVLNYCSTLIDNIRIDTHEDNIIMQNLLKKNEFDYCGIIYVDDGTKRLAYQKMYCSK